MAAGAMWCCQVTLVCEFTSLAFAFLLLEVVSIKHTQYLLNKVSVLYLV